MNKLFAAALCVSAIPGISNAEMINQGYDLSVLHTEQYFSQQDGQFHTYEVPNFFKNNWQTVWGDTAGYVTFESNSKFEANMYLVEYNFDCTGQGVCYSFGDVIAQSGSESVYDGYTQKIEGYLDPFADWSGYALLVLPEAMNIQDIYNFDFSYLKDWTQDPQNDPTYAFNATIPSPVFDGDVPSRPDDVLTLNDQYLIATSQAGVPEPSTLAMFALACAGFFSRRKIFSRK